MPSKEEKRRRANLVDAIAQEETAKAISGMPITFTDLSNLFNYLDERLEKEGCDHTSTITQAFLTERNLNASKILPWLQEYGGYCDCEVLANVEEHWESEIEKNT